MNWARPAAHFRLAHLSTDGGIEAHGGGGLDTGEQLVIVPCDRLLEGLLRRFAVIDRLCGASGCISHVVDVSDLTVAMC